MKRILVTGSYGQIGTELIGAMRKKYGGENVVATGRKKPPVVLREDGPYLQLDVLDTNQLHAMLVDNDIDIVIHNASLLSGTGEKNPQLAYRTNIEGAYNVLEAVRILKLDQTLIPSSIPKVTKSRERALASSRVSTFAPLPAGISRTR